ncbi:MAG: hypothetical protein FWF47_07960 [Clostridia bacterium]|nr:hypothetical protein [Clostridia bacterium]
MKKLISLLVLVVLVCLLIPVSIVIAKSVDVDPVITQDDEITVPRLLLCMLCKEGRMHAYVGGWSSWKPNGGWRTHFGVREDGLERTQPYGKKCDLCPHRLIEGFNLANKWDCSH